MERPSPPCRSRLLLLAVALAAAVPARVLAGGVLLYEVGTAEVGLASAGWGARAQDASTVLTNPAGMARLSGASLSVGGQILYGDVAFTPGAGTSSALGSNGGGNAVGWLPGGGLFFSYAINPSVSVGIAAAGTFGSVLDYDPDWVGRYYGRQATLLGFSVLPSVSWRVDEHFSVGASLNAMYGVLGQKVALNGVTTPDGEMSIHDAAWGVGANAGVLWEPSRSTRLGLVYTSQVSLDFADTPEFTGISPALRALLDARGLTTGKVSVGLHVPQGVMLSAYHEIDARWAVLASAGWQQWSRFGLVEIGISDVADPTSATKDLSFDDTWHLALGGQLRPAPGWRVDAGVAYDSSFQPASNVSPILPTNAAWRFGAGVHRQASDRFGWGASAEYAFGGTLGVDRQGNLPVALGGRGDLQGSYENGAILFLAATFDWKW